MNQEAFQEVWALANVKGDALAVLLALASFCDAERKCKEAPREIAHLGRVAETSLPPILKRLESEGFIETISRGNGRGNWSEFWVFPQGDSPAKGHCKNTLFTNKGHSNNALSVEKAPFCNALSQPQRALQKYPLPNRHIEARTEARWGGEDLLHKSSLCGWEGEEGVTDAPDPLTPAPPNPRSTLLKSPIGQAIFELTGYYPDLGNPRDALELSRLAALLESFPSEEAGAVEIIRRFAFWTLPEPPKISQIVSRWERMERIAQLKQKSQEAQDERLSTSAAPAAYLTPKQQAAANRERDRRQLIDR